MAAAARATSGISASSTCNRGGGAVPAACPDGVFDGIRVDAAGRNRASAGDGVHVYGAEGRRLGRIATPQTVSNLCFGGPARDRPCITASSSLLMIPLAAPALAARAAAARPRGRRRRPRPRPGRSSAPRAAARGPARPAAAAARP
ncbi:SMP-30/gluconolactonase/LRE family protein [Poseidonocella sp. HB161398]|uniref:SMP-30/gluconolactonase/LRE family protein n=1 Tax=Poseidonocella sp. HB161398 TaxID=2320855 RepID=UPI0035185C77